MYFIHKSVVGFKLNVLLLHCFIWMLLSHEEFVSFESHVPFW